MTFIERTNYDYIAPAAPQASRSKVYLSPKYPFFASTICFSKSFIFSVNLITNLCLFCFSLSFPPPSIHSNNLSSPSNPVLRSTTPNSASIFSVVERRTSM
ncbi:hypothetical protein P3342_008638 [Pyrenophora teres f. teres]|nr:hypothetical protein P3342_008638 [Pyrenophora teres f. teres]